MRYFMTDCDFYHKNLLSEMDNRRFESVEQMNEVMIEKWNERVHARDEVVILGDLSLGNGEETNQILNRLKGRLRRLEEGIFHSIHSNSISGCAEGSVIQNERVLERLVKRIRSHVVLICVKTIVFY